MIIYSWFTYYKWWFSIAIISLPEGKITKIIMPGLGAFPGFESSEAVQWGAEGQGIFWCGWELAANLNADMWSTPQKISSY